MMRIRLIKLGAIYWGIRKVMGEGKRPEIYLPLKLAPLLEEVGHAEVFLLPLDEES